MNTIQKEFEKETGCASWINSDAYPDGKIYTKEYTEWLERKIKPNGINTNIMQASQESAQGAAVGNSAAGQSGSDGVMKWCDSCGKTTKWIDGDCENYKTRGGSAKGALPR